MTIYINSTVCINKKQKTRKNYFYLFYKSAEFTHSHKTYTHTIRRIAHLQWAKKRKRKMRKEEKDLSSTMYLDRSSHGKSTRQSATRVGRIEEVVTNKVAGERRRVAESKNDGPPLVAAAMREAHQWPRCFHLNMQAWPSALPFP